MMFRNVKRKWRRVIIATFATIGVASGCITAVGAQGAERVPWAAEITVDAAEEQGRVPPVLTPSVFLTWAEADIRRAFAREVQRLGAIRLGVESQLTSSNSLQDYKRRLGQMGDELKQIEALGGKIILTISRMPRWASSSSSTRSVGNYRSYEASPPRDYMVWEQIVATTVDHFSNRLGLDPLYELWNETDSSHFWSGSKDDYLRLYKSFVAGARRANKAAKLGGPVSQSFDGNIGPPGSHSTSLVFDLIEYASQQRLPELGLHRLPLDFIVWHEFDSLPYFNTKRHVDAVREQLKRFGYEGTKLVIDEWQVAAPGVRDALDSEYGAAYVAASLIGMYKAGIDYQTISLQDPRPGEKTPFHGGFGLVTRGPGPAQNKPGYHVAVRMLNQISRGHLLSVTVAAPKILGEPALHVLAVRDGQTIKVLLSNFIAPQLQVARFALGRGAADADQVERSVRNALVSAQRGQPLAKIISDLVQQPQRISQLRLDRRTKDSLLSAREELLDARRLDGRAATVRVRIANTVARSWRVDHYVVDKQHSNSLTEFKTARGRSRSQELEQIQAQRPHNEQHLTLTVAANSVHLLIFNKAD